MVPPRHVRVIDPQKRSLDLKYLFKRCGIDNYDTGHYPSGWYINDNGDQECKLDVSMFTSPGCKLDICNRAGLINAETGEPFSIRTKKQAQCDIVDFFLFPFSKKMK